MKRPVELFMKNFVAFIFIHLVLVGAVVAQDCEVLRESISGSYEGDCKKGLAHGEGTAKGEDTYAGEFKKGLPHGEGTYTWANGNVYVGEFKDGMMEGEGKMTMVAEEGADEVISGFWEADKYLGKFKEAFNIQSRSASILSVRVTQEDNPPPENQNALFITINEKGKTVFNPDIDISVSVGRHSNTVHTSRSLRVDVVVYPYRFQMRYKGEMVDIEIYREGTYNILVDVNK